MLEFDEHGKFLQAWGGPAEGLEWPDPEHGIYVDYKDHVWIGGTIRRAAPAVTRSDDMLLKFTMPGQLVTQFGKRD